MVTLCIQFEYFNEAKTNFKIFLKMVKKQYPMFILFVGPLHNFNLKMCTLLSFTEGR